MRARARRVPACAPPLARDAELPYMAVIIAVLLAFLKKTNNLHMKPQGARALTAPGRAHVPRYQQTSTCCSCLAGAGTAIRALGECCCGTPPTAVRYGLSGAAAGGIQAKICTAPIRTHRAIVHLSVLSCSITTSSPAASGPHIPDCFG